MSPASALMKLQPVTQEIQGAAFAAGGVAGLLMTRGAPSAPAKEMSDFVHKHSLTECLVGAGEVKAVFVYFDRPKNPSELSRQGRLVVKLSRFGGEPLHEFVIDLADSE